MRRKNKAGKFVGQYRQGDVLIDKTSESLPRDEVPLENGKIVLAHGEVTGHSHAISDAAKFVVNQQTQERYLDTTAAPVQLRHEEHARIEIRRQKSKITIQREYDGEYIRQVAD